MAITDSVVLLTGGLGFIGSHTCVDLINNGHRTIILDDTSNADIDVLDKIENLTNERPIFVEGDVRDIPLLSSILRENNCTSVMHFAGLKAVAESVEFPGKYYDVNFNGTRSLIEAMKQTNCRQMVFSSSATVYGIPEVLPLPEEHVLGRMSPYGFSKMFSERLMMDTAKAEKE